MGYSLTIGNAVLDYDEDQVRVGAEIVRLDNAPAFGEPTDFESQRWPSYSSWAEFCRELGITDAMFGTRDKGKGELEYNGKYVSPLLECHPGATPITVTHVEFIEERLREYKEKHPTHIAQYAPLKPGVEDKGFFQPEEDYVDDPIYDGTLCRGEWLVFWLRWAIENCEKPVFVNT